MKKVLTEEQYIAFYRKHNRCIDELLPRKNPHSDKALITRYNKYLRKFEKKKEKQQDNTWIETRKIVFDRDETCRLISCLSQFERRELYTNSSGFHKVLDPAHVFGKGAFPHMKYDLDNVCVLNRYSHSMLDSGKHPLNGRMISKEEHEEWWIRIIGEDLYRELKIRSKNNGKR